MEHSYSDGILTIKLLKRIDSNNASDVDKEVFAAIDECGAKSVVLDAADTEYISSAGLRVVLKLKKAVAGFPSRAARS